MIEPFETGSPRVLGFVLRGKLHDEDDRPFVFVVEDALAAAGENAWQKWMARLGKPFTQASVRYLAASASEAASAWVREGL